MVEERIPDHPINELFLKRWSPRAMSGEMITKEVLFSLFEAARWAPSSYNNQPWRFVYALKGTSHWDALFATLVPFNQSWCKNAAALVAVVSRNTFSHNGKPSSTHSFDTGAAWMSAALQGFLMGLVVHGIQGFDYEQAREAMSIPEEYTLEMMFVVGKPGKKEDLPQEIQEKEIKSDRKPYSVFVFEGKFEGDEK